MNGFRLDGVRVLVVDDVPAVLDVVTAMLVQNGASVTAVGTAEAALDILRRDHPTVLVSDLAMPGNGGYWLIGQVRALPAGDGGATPAVALTAYTTPDHRAAVLRAGFQVHVAKPVGVTELIDVVATLAAGRATRGVDAASSTR
jgi:CheY-like chemotaxis protein